MGRWHGICKESWHAVWMLWAWLPLWVPCYRNALSPKLVVMETKLGSLETLAHSVGYVPSLPQCHHIASDSFIFPFLLEYTWFAMLCSILGVQQSESVLYTYISSVQFSSSVVSDSLWPHESQHARPPCPLPTPRVYSNSRPLSRWCHPAISSSVVPFSSCPQSLPASEFFPMSQLLTWGGQSTGVSALASVLPMNTQNWSPLEYIYIYLHSFF